jgi:hypothetical protein
MLDNISKGTYGLKVQGFLMCVKMVDNTSIIMMQNPLHVGKTLQNPLLSTSRIVFWGKRMASKNHLLLVLEKFNKDQHRLLEKNIMSRISRIFQLYNELFFLR